MTLRDRLFWEEQDRLMKKAGKRKPVNATYKSPMRRAAEAKQDGDCRWFLLCENPATTTMPHPILGDVPCCARCAAKAGGMADV